MKIKPDSSGSSPGMTMRGETCRVPEPTIVVKARVHMGSGARVEFKPDSRGVDPGISFQSREIAGSSPAMTDEGMKVVS